MWPRCRVGHMESAELGHYQAEIDHLGIARPPAYHYEPETNGCVERFIQTLKEQLLWIERFESFEQLRCAVRDFARLYNREWLLERHGYRTPAEAREYLRSGSAGMIRQQSTEVSGELGAAQD
jgi:transposase InsO family protein